MVGRPGSRDGASAISANVTPHAGPAAKSALTATTASPKVRARFMGSAPRTEGRHAVARAAQDGRLGRDHARVREVLLLSQRVAGVLAVVGEEAVGVAIADHVALGDRVVFHLLIRRSRDGVAALSDVPRRHWDALPGAALARARALLHPADGAEDTRFDGRFGHDRRGALDAGLDGAARGMENGAGAVGVANPLSPEDVVVPGAGRVRARRADGGVRVSGLAVDPGARGEHLAEAPRGTGK